MALVIVYAHFAKVAVTLHAKVSGVVNIVKSIALRRQVNAKVAVRY